MSARIFSCPLLAPMLCLTFVMGVAPASAQMPSTADVFAGYSTLRELGTEVTEAVDYDAGWIVSAAVPVLWDRLAISGEVGANARTNIVDETQRLFAVLGGARVAVLQASRVVVFGQALAGVERFSEPGFDESGFAFQPGVGVDVVVWSPLGVRGQVDWRLARQDTGTYREVRVAVGAVITLGTR